MREDGVVVCPLGCQKSFERLCLQHVLEIKAALGISGVISNDMGSTFSRGLQLINLHAFKMFGY